MFLKYKKNTKYNWKTKINNKNIILKSIIILKIKNFFLKKNVLEIKTPEINHTTLLNTNISLIYAYNYNISNKKKMYLQTSPEYNMKKLLICGTSSIYQISNAFRGKDISKIHNPEFTILEWYRKKYTAKMLIKETIELLKLILNIKKTIKKTYEILFKKILHLIPKNESIYKIKILIKKKNIQIINKEKFKKNEYLDILLKYIIEPKIEKNKLFIFYNYYLMKADLAKKKKNSKRFEIYINEIEIANGSEELQNYNTHIKKFNKINRMFKNSKNLLNNNITLITALYHGLPWCSGIAVGIERIIMNNLKLKNIKHISTFIN